MKRAWCGMVLWCLAVSPLTAQEPTHHNVVEVDTTGSVSPHGRFLSYTNWDIGDLFIRDLKTGENRNLSVHPAGPRLAFTARTEEEAEVWVLENFLPTVETAK